jgi:glycosyltransferase involved in cell wall biosynthesis
VRIAVLLDRWHAAGGGLEEWLRAVTPVLSARGHEVLLIAREADVQPPAGARGVPAATIWPLPRPWRDAADARARVQAVARLQPDAVLDLRASACPGAVWFAMGGFGAERELTPISARRRALLRLEEESVRCASAAVAPSPMVARALRAFRPDLPITVLPLPLLGAIAEARGPDADALAGRRPLRVFFCGRDAERHGLAPALAWFAALKRQVPGAVLETWTKDPVSAAGVISHPWDGQFRAQLGGADLLLHPTRYDSFSLVCLEAAAAGVPVLTTAQAGVAELLPLEFCALAARDQPEPAAAAALRMLRLAAELPRPQRSEILARLRATHRIEDHAERLADLLAANPCSTSPG